MQYLSAAVGGSASGVTSITGLTKWNRLDRFLSLGAENGVYHAGARSLTPAQAGSVTECLEENGPRVVKAIAEIARSGRAPGHTPALLALALAASPKFADAETNSAALEALPVVARNSAQLKKFASYISAHRGWGRSLRNAIARWYLEKPARELARQMLKRQKRSRWSHADLLRLSHPKPATKAHNVLFRWAVEGELGRLDSELREGELKQLYGFELAKACADKHSVIRLIEDYQLTHEMVPEEWLSAPEVWEALLDTMPYGALLRNLGKLTEVGVIAPQGEMTALVAARLVDRHRIARAKVSPVTLLAALLDVRKNQRASAISTALETAYHLALENGTPTGRRVMLLLNAAAAVPSTVLAMWAARLEPHVTIRPEVAKGDRLDRVTAAVAESAGGVVFDTVSRAEAFVCFAGDAAILPALDRYRSATGIAARLVVIAPDAVEAPLGEAGDPLVLQVLGFDAAVPGVVADFIRGPQAEA